MDEDVLSDVVPSNIVSRQVRSSLNFRSTLVCSMSLCSRVRASTGRPNTMTNLWKRTNSSARRKNRYSADALLVKVLNLKEPRPRVKKHSAVDRQRKRQKKR